MTRGPSSAGGGDTLRIGTLVALFVVCAALQSSVAFRMRALGGQPDFLLTLALCVAVQSGPVSGAGTGFLAGLLTASLAGETVGTWIVTRTLIGYAVGSVVRRFLSPSLPVALAGVLIGSLGAGLLFGLSYPRIGLHRWAETTLAGSAWNLLLTLPFALILRKAGWGADDGR